jgi:hypothetical protein
MNSKAPFKNNNNDKAGKRISIDIENQSDKDFMN